jgi:aldose 1-epimerase
MRGICVTLAALGLSALITCAPKKETGAEAKPMIKQQPFGKTGDGKPVEIYTLSNKNGMEMSAMTYGAIITSLKVPDRNGKPGDVVLGFDSLEGYLKGHPYFGAVVGRYGNRIAKGRFKLGGKEYTLAKNNGENSLHGGLRGFDKQVWTAKYVSTADAASVEFTYVSKDGEEGYPGTLTTTVTYTLTAANELKIDYHLSSDKETVANVTNHSYFNLSGQGEGDILGHDVMLNADRFTPVDAGLIPTGELRPVRGTPFDFTQPAAIGARVNQDDEQLMRGKGYDHNFVLNGGGGTLELAARVHDPKSGRLMEVMTTQPGVQFYIGNFLDGTLTGKGGKAYKQRYGFCLETQHFPDSPNQPAFPSTVIKPGEPFHSTTVFRFTAR